jgi:diamine N-acetyltransferase
VENQEKACSIITEEGLMAESSLSTHDYPILVTLEPVTVENWLDCIALEVAPDQRDFVAPNLFSIAQAQFYPTWTPLAIYRATALVGFLLLGKRHSQETTYWIFCFMIDHRVQRRGYGRAAMVALLDRLRQQADAHELKLSYEDENVVAERFYGSLGFESCGRINAHGEPVELGGEKVVRLVLQPHR